MDSRTYYLAGPMTGIPQFNFPLFLETAERLRAQGYDIVSPAELDSDETKAAAMASPDGAVGSGTTNGETWGDFLARDVKLVADEVDGIIALPGWEKSRGAVLETFVARLCGKPVWEVDLDTLDLLPVALELINRHHYAMLVVQTKEVPSYGRAAS